MLVRCSPMSMDQTHIADHVWRTALTLCPGVRATRTARLRACSSVISSSTPLPCFTCACMNVHASFREWRVNRADASAA